MSYVRTDEDIDLIFQHHQEIYSKFDLLDNKMKMIDSLAGVSVDASIDIDATSDTRRTYSGTIVLTNKNSVVGQYRVFDWTDKFVRIYIGLKSLRTLEIKWYPMGLFVFNQNGFKYNHSEHSVSISCTDLVSKLDGTLSGALTGSATIIRKDSEIRKAIIETVKLMGFEKTLVNYWNKKVPYDLEFGTGTTVWNILTELRDLYYPFEMYFDDDTFVCSEIPDCKDDPVMLDSTIMDKIVIDEDTTIDYSEIKNCVEIFGASINSDTHAEASFSNNVYTLKIVKNVLRDGAKYSFMCPSNNPAGCKIQVVYEETTIGPYDVFGSVDENKNDIPLAANTMLSGRAYVVKYDKKASKFYYQGQTDIHAMAMLVDKMPTAAEIEQAKKDEACENLRFVAATDASDTLGLYNNPFSIDKIGRRNYICSGGDFENIYTDSLGIQRSEYTHHRLQGNLNGSGCRLWSHPTLVSTQA